MHLTGSFGYNGGPLVPRHAPTTYNIALWDQVLFHDSRVESLGKTAGSNGADNADIRTPTTPVGIPDADAHNLVQAQSMFPVTSPEEMRAEFIADATVEDWHGALVQRLVPI